MLQSADQTTRVALYEALGLRLTWHPDDNKGALRDQPGTAWSDARGGVSVALGLAAGEEDA